MEQHKINERDYHLYISEVLIQWEKGKTEKQIADWVKLPVKEVERIINNNNYSK